MLLSRSMQEGSQYIVRWGRERSRPTSGIPAHCSQLNSLGLCTSMCVDTTMYSAYAPVQSSVYTRSYLRILQLTAISQTKHLISNLEPTLRSAPKCLNYTGKLDTQGLRRLWRDGILALTLKYIHAVQAECFNFDESLGVFWNGFRDFGDVEGFCGARASLDFCISRLIELL